MIQAIALGLTCWIATMIVVESEIARPVREWLDRCYLAKPTSALRWKARYLAYCHLCAGTWIAFVMQAIAPVHVVPGTFTFILNALLIKAFGHAALVLQNAMAK